MFPQCLWSYFGSRHGKGPNDDVGAVVKCFLHNAQLDQHKLELKNAELIVNFLKANFSSCLQTSYS